MEDLRLADRARRRLVGLLAEDRPDPDRWLSRLRSFSDAEGQPGFTHAVRLLFHLDLPQDEAGAVMERVLAHRAAMASALGRDPGLRVAGVDYLSNVEHRLANPKIVATAEFERTERHARTDVLTGLFNRRFFREAVEGEIRRARRYRSPVALVLIDVDHFKEVNDRHGHVLGDQVLARLGAIVRRCVREADVPCRFGGEEFAVILPETPRLGAWAVGERVRIRVEETFASAAVAGELVPLTVSGGIACLPEDGTTSSALAERADRALYLAKRAGRNRIVAYHDEKRADVRFPTRPEVYVRVSSDGQAASPARLIDVSRTGALIEAERLPTPADLVAIDVEAPCPQARLRGRVARVEGPAGETSARRAGVVFETPIGDDLLRGRLTANVTPSRGGRGVRR